jgi:hypothetical protein
LELVCDEEEEASLFLSVAYRVRIFFAVEFDVTLYIVLGGVNEEKGGKRRKEGEKMEGGREEGGR